MLSPSAVARAGGHRRNNTALGTLTLPDINKKAFQTVRNSNAPRKIGFESVRASNAAPIIMKKK